MYNKFHGFVLKYKWEYSFRMNETSGKEWTYILTVNTVIYDEYLSKVRVS